MDDEFLTRKTLLLRACNPDDEEAWADFVSYYEAFIEMVLNRFLFDKSDLQDLKQDILLKLWEKLKSYDQNKSKFRTWLSTVIKNTVINHIKKKNKNSDFLIPEAEELFASSPTELENLIQNEWETYASNLALERIKPLFSENAVEIFMLSLENLSVNQVAEKLEIAPDSVYKMKSRFIKRLQKEITLIRSETEF